ncbi:FAD-dependent oxidoreductase [Streptomyces sp. NPDC059866]|uniref:FAD-dependent oxidoreductase n=1 Tax=Streptomyces sp. NPDC059866 TaxID=3346978 RepID=UPI003656F705
MHTGATLTAVRTRDGEKAARVRIADGAELELRAEELLVATGCRPVAEGLGLDRVGVKTGALGEVVVDESLRTGHPRICAAGDVTGGQQFVGHVGADQLADQHRARPRRHCLQRPRRLGFRRPCRAHDRCGPHARRTAASRSPGQVNSACPHPRQQHYAARRAGELPDAVCRAILDWVPQDGAGCPALETAEGSRFPCAATAAPLFTQGAPHGCDDGGTRTGAGGCAPGSCRGPRPVPGGCDGHPAGSVPADARASDR